MPKFLHQRVITGVEKGELELRAFGWCRRQEEVWGNLSLEQLQKPHKSKLELEKEAWGKSVRLGTRTPSIPFGTIHSRSRTLYLPCPLLNLCVINHPRVMCFIWWTPILTSV